MKFNIIPLLFGTILVVLLALSLHKQSNARYSYKEEQLIEPLVVGTPDTPLFYGVNVEMSQLLPTSENYVVSDKGEDLIEIASRLGVNMFRITNETYAFNDRSTFYTRKQWEIVLDKMSDKNIKALILIESPTIYQSDISTEYLDFVQDYIIDSSVLSHPNVYGVVLYNEPLVNERNVTLLKTAAERIKINYPQARLTVGWWAVDTGKTDKNGEAILDWDAYGEGQAFENFVDFYSLHMYGFDKENLLGLYPDPYKFTLRFITKVKKGLKTEKPMLIGEFGAANGDAISDQDTIGSPELQANTYAGVYQALKDLNDPQVIGSVSFQFYQRSDALDAWAILKEKGNYLYPAAYVLQRYAKSETDVPL